MTTIKHLAVVFLFIYSKSSVNGSVININNDNDFEDTRTVTDALINERSLFGGIEEKNLEREILQELNHLSARQQRQIFSDLEKQQERFNASEKGSVLFESENLSPLNVEELKSIRKSIAASNSSLPAIRNKRTLNFLLFAVARAMGYTLTPTNPAAEWIPKQQSGTPSQPPPCNPPPSTPPPCPMPSASPPCAMPPTSPPCAMPSASPPCAMPSASPPCTMPPASPPCPGQSAIMQPATIPPYQIDVNTIRYPYRPARTIPVFNFAPLPAGIRVPYPPLFQPLQQRSPCTPQQPSPSPCGASPSPPPCGAPPSPAPCGVPPSPPPCGTPPPKPQPPCGSPPPPCTTPSPAPPPCKSNPPPSPPPCGATPAPKTPPCSPPPPPCAPPAPSPSPCNPPPSPKQPPCQTPVPPCKNPAPPPSDSPKKGSIVLEYDDPVRIQIFSNEKKYLPASGNIFSGYDEDHKEDWHSYFFPESEKSRKEDEEFEEKQDVEEEHSDDEENNETSGQIHHYEEEDERTSVNNEEDESETNLSVVKKPAEIDIKKTHKRPSRKNKNEEIKQEDDENSKKVKKPKRKKWIRIVKKQRRKTKNDSETPDNTYQIYSSDTFAASSSSFPKYYGRSKPKYNFDSYEKDTSDISDDSSSSEDFKSVDIKKVVVNDKIINSPENRAYEFNFNPYALEPEDERRKKLEKAVERYVEDYVEKQLGDELIKNTGKPKTTVFEFAPKNGPKIQTITTTVAKTSGSPSNSKPQVKPETQYYNKPATGSGHFIHRNRYDENSRKRGNAYYETYVTRP